MKKNFKKAMAAVMAAALTLSLAGNAAEADAAKKAKLAKKSVSVTVGQTATVKIKNVKAKNVKKLSVKSANKKIVTVKKSGKTAVKVTGKKANSKAVKVTVSVTQKGQKKATKLTLKVKVTAKQQSVTPGASAPAASAPAASAPGTSTQPDQSAAPDQSAKPGASAPAASAPAASKKPVVTAEPKEPAVNLTLEEDAINAKSSLKAEVTVSAGEVTSVEWSVKDTAVASVQKDASDAKKATVTGVAEGETKVIAAVKVTVQGKEFTITKEADLLVVKEGSPIIRATIESAPAEMAVEETAGATISVTANKVAVETENIESAEWSVDGDAVEIVGDGLNAVVTAKKLGEATISVKVKMKSGDEGTGKFKITVTPYTTYMIGKEIQVDGSTWNAVFLTDLAKQIKVKRTDMIEVFFSSTGDGVQLVLSSWTAMGNTTAQNLMEQAPFRSDDVENGKATFTLNEKFFEGIYSEINSVGATCSEEATITIEKIRVIPTDELAFAVKAPAGIEIGTPGEILAGVDEGYTLEWTSSDEKIATVTGDNTKATVTGIEAGKVTITVTVKSADGKEVKKQEIELDVTKPFKGTVIPIDLGDVEALGSGDLKQNKEGNKVTSITVTDEDQGLTIELPNKLVKGDKIKVTVKGSLTAAAKGFRLYTTPARGYTGGSTNNNQGITGSQIKEGDFTCELTLEASQDCTHLCVRTPVPGGSDPVTGLTITEVSFVYL